MQKGFATLELVLVMLIIVVLAGAAIPNAVRVLDRVALDYETKRLYTDLRALQAYDRMTNMRDSHFYTAGDDESFVLNVSAGKYVVETNATGEIHSAHYFSNGVTADKNMAIKFDDMGKVSSAISDRLHLNSRFGKRTAIIFDSVGRFRGERD